MARTVIGSTPSISTVTNSPSASSRRVGAFAGAPGSSGLGMTPRTLRVCQEITESTFDSMKIGVCNLLFIPYVVVVINVDPIRERFSTVAPFLDERGRRLVAAAEAFAAGYGGITAVAKATGMAPSTIGRGLKELAQDEPL